MNHEFVVLQLFQHEVSCTCPGQQHQHVIEFRKGDVLTITNERKYVDCLGWHLLVDVNNTFQVFICLSDLESLYEQGLVRSLLDLNLESNYLCYKINAALDALDREAFFTYTAALSNVQAIMESVRRKTTPAC